MEDRSHCNLSSNFISSIMRTYPHPTSPCEPLKATCRLCPLMGFQQKGIVEQEQTVKYVPRDHGNGCRSMGKRAEGIPRSILRSWVCVGQRAWLQPGGCTLMGCQCPILGEQGWAKAQPGHMRNKAKRGNEMLGRILDIMAREFYLLQETIYSNRQTMVSYYNRTRIGQRGQ